MDWIIVRIKRLAGQTPFSALAFIRAAGASDEEGC
jgi:hypothetical protein